MSGNSILRNKVPVKIKRLHPDAVIPRYATDGAVGFDLVAVEDVVIEPGETKKVPLGLSFEIPEGYVMYVCMRSGIALKTKLRQPNGIGVIDSDYRGEVAMMFDNIAPEAFEILDGHKTSLYNMLEITTVDGDAVEDIESHPLGTYIIRKGDRVAQGVIAEAPQAIFEEVDELGETERGDGGFGSTGVK
ncbi:dUTP diphosphatase [Aneurinibacillus aneurinilyticus]|uniref:dUTP diphosphatase n=1 Tax=Aneurinibacillus aneurinilyticus TaxID=1391 RepID=UPI0023F28CF6|nr:deoxyuridine 5'-triphosphate nucleotidohydrolase [Aneurinibacillus aneurinilyticus]